MSRKESPTNNISPIDCIINLADSNYFAAHPVVRSMRHRKLGDGTDVTIFPDQKNVHIYTRRQPPEQKQEVTGLTLTRPSGLTEISIFPSNGSDLPPGEYPLEQPSLSGAKEIAEWLSQMIKTNYYIPPPINRFIYPQKIS